MAGIDTTVKRWCEVCGKFTRSVLDLWGCEVCAEHGPAVEVPW